MSTTEIVLRVKAILSHFLKDFDMEQNTKKNQAQKLKMADESNMAAKTFFSD
jgi:hypothetical protein